MLRTPFVRSRARLLGSSYSPVVAQWQLNRPRYFANNKRTDETVLPSTQTPGAINDPLPPKISLASEPPPPTVTINTANIPKAPPSPEKVGAIVPPTSSGPASTSVPSRTPSAATTNLPPTGTGTASTGPAAVPPPPPRRKPRRFRRFLTSLLILSTLGYAGGVYYSLVSDNFHDFFTEYVPFGEDAVGYFEEREFRKRFPARPVEQKNYPQLRGENKVTIGKSSGLSPRIAKEEKTADLGHSGRHTSALDDNVAKPKPAPAPASAPSSDSKPVVKKAADKVAETADKAKSAATSAVAAAAPATTATRPASALIDHVAVPNAAEPVVQTAVKMVNDIITVINEDPNASKYQTTLAQAKSQLSHILKDIAGLKERAEKDASDKISGAHKEFDTAAKELVSRLEKEMQSQEVHWREEYESEREKLSQSYQARLAAELDSVRKVAEQRVKNALVEQEIALHKKFAQSVQDKVETERNGRLSKLNELASGVEELEKLSGEWNSVVDANLATQHLHVAIESVRAAMNKYDHPTPFVNELAALKEMSNSNEVVNAAIASIPPVAYQRGLPTSAHLIDRFRRVASEVRKAALLPEDAGVASHAASAVLSRLMFSKKSEGMPEGNDVEAVLTRTEVLLEEGNLDGAAREMNGLHGWAGVLSQDWVKECRRVLETKQALDVIATEARLQSLLVD